MRNLALALEYEGTAYFGFGIQPGLPTIQGELERALRTTLGHGVRVTPAGRTDAGVHATGQVVSFRTESKLDVAAVQRALNARLPADIVVRRVIEVPEWFDARRSARSRRYRYSIWRGEQRNVWLRRTSYHFSGHLDLDAMREATEKLLGRHDFAAFTRKWGEERRRRLSTVRTVFQAEWSNEGQLLHFDIAADAFLRHMVRTIVGSLLWVGRGRLTPEQFGRLLEPGTTTLAGPTAPPHGLTLTGVDYNWELT